MANKQTYLTIDLIMNNILYDLEPYGTRFLHSKYIYIL